MASVIDRNYLRDFFKIEDEGLLDRVQELLKPLPGDPGATVCRCGERADSMFFIESGHLEVWDAEGNLLNELGPGQYFGEFAVVTQEPRLATVTVRDSAVLFQLNRRDLMDILTDSPGFFGSLLKKLYRQIASKHAQILELTQNRGSMRTSKPAPFSYRSLLVTYGSVLFVLGFFAVAGTLWPHPLWALGPVVFLIAYASVTKRTAEAIVFATLMELGLTGPFDFLWNFCSLVYVTSARQETVDIVLPILLIGSMITLVTAAGGLSSFSKRIASHIPSAQGTYWAAFFLELCVFIDDYLAILTVGPGTKSLADRFQSPREETAFVIGSVAPAVAGLVPISLYGVYLTGIVRSQGGSGASAFRLVCEAAPFGWFCFALLAVVILQFSRLLPRWGGLAEAERRVLETGKLAPPGSEEFELSGGDGTGVGGWASFVLPVVFLVLSSLVLGTALSGSFSSDMKTGVLLTLGFMFFLYLALKVLTPEDFFDQVIQGVKSMVSPTVLLVLTLCFASSVQATGIMTFLTQQVPLWLSGAPGLFPATVFILFTLMAFFLGSAWTVVALAVPIVLPIGQSMGIPLGLCLGTLSSAAIAGNYLCLYQSDNYLVASAVGCEPFSLAKVKLAYGSLAVGLCLAAYLVVGLVY